MARPILADDDAFSQADHVHIHAAWLGANRIRYAALNGQKRKVKREIDVLRKHLDELERACSE